MASKNRRIRLLEKDIKFMKYLHAVKIATYEQATRDIYTGYKRRALVKGLESLRTLALSKVIVRGLLFQGRD